jgi:hypothetical protein
LPYQVNLDQLNRPFQQPITISIEDQLVEFAKLKEQGNNIRIRISINVVSLVKEETLYRGLFRLAIPFL